MCCIFTCCGWVIDLVQRFWTFTMSCCISSAVCCALITASMSGVALGYNYSLAEYIELKETNVSVYLKRGVFDDEVADEMDWRRSGGGPPVKRASPAEYQPPQQAPFAARREMDTTPMATDDDMPIRYGRRMDDSIFQSDDNRRYEGSLLKLTPYDLASTPKNTIPGVTVDPSELPGPHGPKEFVGAMNARRMEQAASNQQPTARVIAVPADRDEPQPMQLNTWDVTTVQSLRFPPEIPPGNFVGDRPAWMIEGPQVTVPRIITVVPVEPWEPENVQDILSKLLKRKKVKTIGQMRARTTTTIPTKETTTTARAVAGFKVAENVNDADFNETGLRPSESEKSEPDKDYSEDDIKGLPIRKRRHRRNIKKIDIDTSSNALNTTIKLDVVTLDKKTIEVGTKQNETKENNLLQKIISVIKSANNIFALAQSIKLELSKANITLNSTTSKTTALSINSELKRFNTASTYKMPFSDTQSTINDDLLLKIIKSTIIPLS